MCATSALKVVPPSSCVEPYKGRRPAAPILNCEDLPESIFPGGSRPTSKRAGGFRSGCTKPAVLRGKQMSASLQNGHGFTDAEHDVSRGVCSLEEQQPWQCTACTFENHASLPHCEMCQTKRGAKLLVASPPDPIPTFHSDEWPTLEDVHQNDDASWIHCDTSDTASVALSWLDVADVDSPQQQAKMLPAELSWAKRLGTVSIESNSFPMCKAGLSMPLLRTTISPPKKITCQGIDDDNLDIELDNLEKRRIRPRLSKAKGHCIRERRK